MKKKTIFIMIFYCTKANFLNGINERKIEEKISF